MAQYIISEAALIANARILAELAQQSGAHMLIALKAFSTIAGLNILAPYAQGACASGLYEARLAQQHIKGEIAVYSPAYRPEELSELLEFAHHIDFNSLSQWERYREEVLASPRHKSGELLTGLRINPCHSTGDSPLYDPCIPGSRLGITAEELAKRPELLNGISGLHIHTLCEQGAEALIETFRALEQHCGALLASPAIRYLNLGGGHWISKPEYNRPALIGLIKEIREKYQLEVYLEPGEAWCIHTGVLRAQVLDIFDSLGYRHAILDVSASAHMPDILEMPYRPEVFQVLREENSAATSNSHSTQPALSLLGEKTLPAQKSGQLPYTYRLGAPTCLAGDVMGDYSFAQELQIGDSIIFDDMSHYTIVKTNHFNGVPHPEICLLQSNNTLKSLKKFTYQDFKSRLG